MESTLMPSNHNQSLNGSNVTANALRQNLTYDKLTFDQMLAQYNHQQTLPCSVDLTQAFLMTSNMIAAANTNLSSAQFDTVTDFIGSADSLAGSMIHMSRIIQGMGPADKSSNFLIAQKQLIEAQSKEDAELREAMNEEIVDGLDYVRIREQIAYTKQRVKPLLSLSDDSDDCCSDDEKKVDKETSAQDSQEYIQKNKLSHMRLQSIVRQIRQDGRQYLGITGDQLPLSQIFRRLSRNKGYLKKRELKVVEKENQNEQRLEHELHDLNQKLEAEFGHIDRPQDLLQIKTQLKHKIAQLKQVLGLEARIQPDKNPITAAEIDLHPLTQNSLAILNILQGQQADTKLVNKLKRTKDADNIFGRYKKLQSRSQLLQSFPKDSPVQTQAHNQKQADQPYQSTQEIVKVIGLEPEILFKTMSKYKVDIDKIPTFSNQFESYETFIPGTHVTHTAAPITQAQNISDKQSYVRLDGRSVLSLPFNPYQLENPQKSKLYQAVIHDFFENRTQALKTINQGAREKMEAGAIKRVWTQIAKRDIPKAYRAFQKHHSDSITQPQKLAAAAQRELRKKALKSQRVVKESVARSKKLTKDVMNFWKKRDRELADLKRKKEKFDKEMRKKQQEEEEQLLQKKRLEYLMKQSEIYAHFMANKMGMSSEVKQEARDQIQAETDIGVGRVEVDEASARRKMAKMINEDRGRLKDFDGSEASMVNEDDLDVNRFDTDNQQQKPIETPSILNAKLKEYQLRGLRWLDNLYEQGINGILADEMGLGKTIQAISLMAHIAESKGVWGPFLVVVPVTTLHNWQNELKKFCPSLKVLPYFGNQEERKKLSKFLDPKNMMNPALQIHVVITSYNLIVNNPKDQARLLKLKWNYMILDEAQAIKNNLSRRWKVLLQFQTRNRLLLTGTPIQNSMAELWALLHFIMPKLFDNHEQFQEWFSKDIEASSLNQGELNKIQLKRLHAVLKPFMLRRLKKDVEQEIAPKTEVVIHCDMTYRQRVLYQRIRSKISYKDLHSLSENKSKMENLMNLVMHMRKVCNHPDLFECRDAKIPVAFRKLQIGVQPNSFLSSSPDVRALLENPIEFNVPKLVFDELMLISDNSQATFYKQIPNEDVAFSNVSKQTHFDLFNIFTPSFLHKQMFTSQSQFGILRLFCKSNSYSVADIVYLINADPLLAAAAIYHSQLQRHVRRVSYYLHQADTVEIPFYGGLPTGKTTMYDYLNVQIIDQFNQEYSSSILYREQKIVSVVDNSLDVIPPMIPTHQLDSQYYAHQIKSLEIKKEISQFVVQKCVADTIQMVCASSGTFRRYAASTKHNPNAKRFLLGTAIKLQKHLHIQKCSGGLYSAQDPIITPMSLLRLPNHKQLVQDCAKMQQFAQLIPQLVAGKHRCLVFCQMTKMLDLLEDYLLTQHLSYFRMDGSTALQDRRFMVDEYQKNPNIFAFLLSTRAGGLGINLIAADTVIFYDIDWNPTMDEQATDRAHRIGQTKPVTIYRLVTRGTVEEKIVRRAQQKQNVQSTVYGDSFKVRDVQMMLADDDEPEQQQGFIKSRKRGGKKQDTAKASAVKLGKKQPIQIDIDDAMEESSESDNSEGFVVQLEGNEVQELNNDNEDVEMQEDY